MKENEIQIYFTISQKESEALDKINNVLYDGKLSRRKLASLLLGEIIKSKTIYFK